MPTRCNCLQCTAPPSGSRASRRPLLHSTMGQKRGEQKRSRFRRRGFWNVGRCEPNGLFITPRPNPEAGFLSNAASGVGQAGGGRGARHTTDLWRPVMRRLLISLAAVAMFVTATGCIAVSSKNNRFASDADVIAVDGRVYVVNKCTGAVRTVDERGPPDRAGRVQRGRLRRLTRALKAGRGSPHRSRVQGSDEAGASRRALRVCPNPERERRAGVPVGARGLEGRRRCAGGPLAAARGSGAPRGPAAQRSEPGAEPREGTLVG